MVGEIDIAIKNTVLMLPQVHLPTTLKTVRAAIGDAECRT
jgi:hypothetical protein